MSKYTTAIERVTYSSLAVSLAAETEKILLTGSVREELSDPASWPLIYTSYLLPAALVGIGAGAAGKKIAEARDRRAVYMGEYTSPRRTKLVAAAAGGLIALAPVSLGYAAEMTDKCSMMSAEQRGILECEPDPIDAGSILLGAAMGLAYATRKVETGVPTAFA